MTPEEICAELSILKYRGQADFTVLADRNRIGGGYCSNHGWTIILDVEDAERIALSYTQEEEIENLKAQVAEYELFKSTFQAAECLPDCNSIAHAELCPVTNPGALILQHAKEITALRMFAQRIMDNWPTGDVDGGELQEAAVACGLLHEVTATEPCGENCQCAEYYAPDEWPVKCLRRRADKKKKNSLTIIACYAI